MHCFYELNSQEWTAGLKGQCIFMLNIPNLFSKAIVNFYLLCHARWASLVAQMVKNQSAMQETWVWDLGSITGSGRSSGEGHGYPLQCSCLEDPMDRGAWWAAVRGVTRVRHDWVPDAFTYHFYFRQCLYFCSCLSTLTSSSPTQTFRLLYGVSACHYIVSRLPKRVSYPRL